MTEFNQEYSSKNDEGFINTLQMQSTILPEELFPNKWFQEQQFDAILNVPEGQYREKNRAYNQKLPSADTLLFHDDYLFKY